MITYCRYWVDLMAGNYYVVPDLAIFQRVNVMMSYNYTQTAESQRNIATASIVEGFKKTRKYSSKCGSGELYN